MGDISSNAVKMMKYMRISDPEVQKHIHDVDRQYYPSPVAWEDEILYLVMPDRFSDNKESHYLNNEGSWVEDGTTPLYQPSDEGNALKDAESATAWHKSGQVFVGGTLKGITSKMGYMSRLGITAIWLAPFFKQVKDTYHGYATQDFLDVDRRVGTREDLKELVEVAHSFGIRVLLDATLNHAGDVFMYEDLEQEYAHKICPIKGYYDQNREATIPFDTVDMDKFPDCFPNGAVWPMELQAPENFMRKGRIGPYEAWDRKPDYLEGDFYDFKKLNLGNPEDPDHFKPTIALKNLINIYKFWTSFADLDGLRLDAAKHIGDGPLRFFTSSMKEYAQRLGKHNFLVIAEIPGPTAFDTVHNTGMDAALGIGGLQEALWKAPQGLAAATDYFDLFKNAKFLKLEGPRWLRNEVVCMLDDHDQVWRPVDSKKRYCSEKLGPELLKVAMALNLFTLGIPCIYYGTEQALDGDSSVDTEKAYPADQYIRETMFGGPFGPFRTTGLHVFNEMNQPYIDISKLTALRTREIALRRGRQYLRPVSEDGKTFGFPDRKGKVKSSIIAWSRIHDGVEVLCAVNTSTEVVSSAWVTVDDVIHDAGDLLQCLYPEGRTELEVSKRNGKAVAILNLEPGFAVVYK